MSDFQSTLPVRGATIDNLIQDARSVEFNPRSPCGERPRERAKRGETEEFQSTLPVRGATGELPPPPYLGNISIHAPVRGAT